MNLTYRKAKIEDIDNICSLVARAVKNMTSNGIYQWDELYPTREDFMSDIEKEQLYTGISDGRIAVIFVINKEYDPEYDDAQWHYTGDNFVVIHRLCVDPDFQHRGIAKMTMLHIEDTVKSQGIESVRLDTFTQNSYALKLYDSLGFNKTGYADWRKGRFVLLDKVF